LFESLVVSLQVIHFKQIIIFESMQVLDNFLGVFERHVFIIVRVVIVKVNFRSSFVIFIFLFLLRVLVEMLSVRVS
jgi:hypothetical protein